MNCVLSLLLTVATLIISGSRISGYHRMSEDCSSHSSLISEYQQDVSPKNADAPVRRVSSDAEENTNIVNHYLDSDSTTYEVFDPNNYPQRNSYIEFPTLDTVDTEIIEDGSGDGREHVGNPKYWPYLPTAKIRMTYHNVYDKVAKVTKDRVFSGTAFLVGPNIAVTAGHCCYYDVTSGDFDDGTNNPRFPDKMEFFFGCESEDDLNQGSSYEYYAEGSIINIEYSYFLSRSSSHDWGAVMLDWYIGNDIGWYGKKKNWYEYYHDVYSWGYPVDKTIGTLWRTDGRLVEIDSNKYQYHYDLVTWNGQSGSPIFMTDSTGTAYVCDIHTYGGSGYNSGTMINDLIYAYLDCFLNSQYSGYSYTPLKLSVIGKSGSEWKIKITNTTSHSRKVFYNSKKCNFSDARDWSNLKDIKKFELNPYSSHEVKISENWFATSIAVSYIYKYKRVITYADHLKESDDESKEGTLQEHYNTIPC